MENKQTAVDFIFSQLPDEYTTTRQGFEVYKQAKQMEKEQIMDAHYAPKYGCFNEEYYKETYGGKDGE
jgi:hypothetical protein